jgi:hypothetical protein
VSINHEIEAVVWLKSQVGALADQDPEFWVETIEAETGLWEAIDRLVLSELEDRAQMEAIEKVIDRQQERLARVKERITLKRSLLQTALETAGVKKRVCPAGTVTLRPSAPKVVVIDESQIPSTFWKPSDPKLDKRAVLDALKGGAPVPGCTLSNAETTISIRS